MIIPTMATTAAQRLLKVAIVGLPNAGKSTLINNLMSLVVCPVSKRVHTTRTNQQTAFQTDDAQVVFVDTPGLVNMKEIKKFAFAKDFIFGPEQSVRMADVVAVIHDLSNAISRDKLDPRIRGLLEKFPEKNAVLILNKVDKIKGKGLLLDLVRILTSGIVDGRVIRMKKSHLQRVSEEKVKLGMDNVLKRARLKAGMEEYDLQVDDNTTNMVMSAFTEEEIKEGLHLVGWPNFKDVFMISALKGDGVDLLKDYFVSNAKPSSWMFGEDFLTDVDPKEMTIRVIKSLLLDKLPQEIPYLLHPTIEYWDQTDSGETRIVVQLKCPTERHVGRVYGTGGAVIQRVTSETENILSELLRAPVNLVINPYAEKKKT